ncbi:NAD(P)H-dependent oxidoreductase [Pseudooceanicola sp. C21-150M6]|uniref:NAD(P)H-dependent oxidoreductase n=1 Tax=Pseudooceanicola sp. C21-150M6 TaxID=3434355 RepID=UPI003D7FD6FC
MRALIIYCHPRDTSFTAAIRDRVMAQLDKAGIEHRMIDLYAEGFNPVMSAQEHTDYLTPGINRAALESHVELLEWCDALIFVYPTWWYGLPAMLKGWLDRVLLPGIAFHMPQAEGETIRPGLTHITRLGVFTTCGASWWLTRYIGAPGRRTLIRGVRLLCAQGCLTAFAAHYLMDSSSDASRARHMAKVDKEMAKFLRGLPVPAEVKA